MARKKKKGFAEEIQKLLAQGMTIAKMAEESGLNQANFYKWKEGKAPDDYEVHKILQDYLNEKLGKTQKIEDQQEEYKKQGKPVFYSLPLNKTGNPEHYEGNKVIPGKVTSVNGEPVLIVYNLDLPVLEETDGFIEVIDNRMIPVFTQGTLLAIKKLEDYDLIQYDSYYFVIDTSYECLVSKVKHSEEANSIKLSFENNKEYKPFTRSLDKILAIYKIKGYFTRR